MKATEEVLLQLASIEKGEVAVLDLNPPNPQDIEDSEDEAEVPEVPEVPEGLFRGLFAQRAALSRSDPLGHAVPL